jgi:hypothetical protein
MGRCGLRPRRTAGCGSSAPRQGHIPRKSPMARFRETARKLQTQGALRLAFEPSSKVDSTALAGTALMHKMDHWPHAYSTAGGTACALGARKIERICPRN